MPSCITLNVSAVCDYRSLLLDVECRWSGSVHDAKMFANSSINRKLQNSQLPKVYLCILLAMSPLPNYIVGDPAYPLTPFFIKKLDTCSSNAEVIFNNLLRSARNPVECAFGRLKPRWSILILKMDLKLDNIPTVIYACFLLHNLCEYHNTYTAEDLVELKFEVAKRGNEGIDDAPDPVYSCNISKGEVVRRMLIEYIKTSLPDHLVTRKVKYSIKFIYIR